MPILEELFYDASSGLLTCVSSGGPATEVEWTMDGIPSNFSSSQVVMDTKSASYNNFLFLNRNPDSVIGNYTCQVKNARNESETFSHQLQGEYNTLLLFN